MNTDIQSRSLPLISGMPVMNGIEATKKIRALDREDHDVLIFAMTANTMTRDRKLCVEAGMDIIVFFV